MFKRLALVPLALAYLSGGLAHAQSNPARATGSTLAPSPLEAQLESVYGVPLTPLATYAEAHTADGELSIQGRHLVLVAEEPTGSRPHYAAFVGPVPEGAPYAPPMHVSNGENNVPARLASGPYDALAESWFERMPENAVWRIRDLVVRGAVFEDLRFAGISAETQPDGSKLLEAHTGSFGLSGLVK